MTEPTRSTEQPALSVILVTLDTEEVLRTTLRHLRAQTVRKQMEVVIAAPRKERVTVDAALRNAFYDVQVVEVGAISSSAQARAAAVPHARAPVVALGEDHCFPESDWAEQILEAHQKDWAAVGPALGNANPETTISWANLFIEYGTWMQVPEPTERDHLPGHNSSYKRALLLEYGDDLGAMMEAESVLHWDLREKGHRLLLDPAIRTRHVNYSLLGDSLRLRFEGGRAFAAARAQQWSPWRRLLYAVATPLIPPMRFQRILRQGWRAETHRKPLLRSLPALAVLLVADGLGELVGYVSGEGSTATLTQMEFHRERHVRPKERSLLLS